MNKEERIRELASDMDYGCTKRDLYPDDAKEIAKALDILGYRKIVWHKIADGDLPKYTGRYLVILDDESLPEYRVDSYENFWDGKRWTYNEGRVIAWTELPTYIE